MIQHVVDQTGMRREDMEYRLICMGRGWTWGIPFELHVMWSDVSNIVRAACDVVSHRFSGVGKVDASICFVGTNRTG